MTDRSKLLALAEAVEAATGQDRALDDAIAATIFRFAGMSQLVGVPDEHQFRTFAYLNGSIGSSLRYSGSLDAAMTLVPDNHLASVKQLWDGPQRYGYAAVRRYADNATDCDGKSYVSEENGGGATPALALCAAALRAQAEALA